MSEPVDREALPAAPAPELGPLPTVLPPARALTPLPVLAPLRARTFFLFALVYLYAFPYFDQLRSANEMPRILMTQQMVDRHTFRVDERLGDMGSRLDLSRGPDGHWYPNKAPGPSFLAVPAYLLCKLFGAKSLGACTWAFRVTAVTLPALLFLPFFYRLTRRFTPDEPARRTTLAAYALASPALPYGILFMSHQVAAVTAGASFIAAVATVRGDARRPTITTMAVGFFAALAVMMDYQASLAVLLIGLYLVIRSPHRLRSVALACIGGSPVAAALGAYHAACFGSPLKTGYNFSVDTVTREGFMGIVGPSRESFFSTVFMPANGIVVLAPWVLLAVVGGIAVAADRDARKRIGAEALVCAAIFVVYVAFLSSLVPYMARGGWCVGPRYMTVSLPFIAWLATAGFAAADRRTITSVLARSLVIASGVVYVATATTYPHWPDQLQNPLYELVFRLIYRGYAVHSLGTAAGLRGIASLLPLYLGALVLMLWLVGLGRRRAWQTTALACVLAAGVVAGHRAFPLTGPYSDRAWAYITSTWEPKR